MDMLDYAKIVLLGVCFNKQLFKKELIKIINWAEPDERGVLETYIFEKYYDIYPEILDEVFVRRSTSRYYSSYRK